MESGLAEIFSRYSRQVVFEKINAVGQEKISSARVAIIGVGAIGSTAAQLLARAGIGKFLLVDRDIVEENNLQRQFFTEADIGVPKAVAAAKLLRDTNSSTKIESKILDLDPSNIRLLEGYDLILDGMDNMETRFLINDFAKKNAVPWIYAAAIKSTAVVMPIFGGGVCFRCVFTPTKAGALETCETAGVLATATTAAATIQATEALKILTGRDREQKIVHYDVWTHDFKVATPQKNPTCPACRGKFEFLESDRGGPVKLCGAKAFQIKSTLDFEAIKRRLLRSGIEFSERSGVGRAKFGGHDILIFEDGRVVIRDAADKKGARAVFSKIIGN